jgi:hypothetical protein
MAAPRCARKIPAHARKILPQHALGTVWLPLDFKNLDKKNLEILKSHPNRLGVYKILTHIHKIQEIPKIIFIPNLDFRISSKRALNLASVSLQGVNSF